MPKRGGASVVGSFSGLAAGSRSAAPHKPKGKLPTGPKQQRRGHSAPPFPITFDADAVPTIQEDPALSAYWGDVCECGLCGTTSDVEPTWGRTCKLAKPESGVGDQPVGDACSPHWVFWLGTCRDFLTWLEFCNLYHEDDSFKEQVDTGITSTDIDADRDFYQSRVDVCESFSWMKIRALDERCTFLRACIDFQKDFDAAQANPKADDKNKQDQAVAIQRHTAFYTETLQKWTESDPDNAEACKKVRDLRVEGGNFVSEAYKEITETLEDNIKRCGESVSEGKWTQSVAKTAPIDVVLKALVDSGAWAGHCGCICLQQDLLPSVRGADHTELRSANCLAPQGDLRGRSCRRPDQYSWAPCSHREDYAKWPGLGLDSGSLEAYIFPSCNCAED
jgi:hypothetical protein